MRLSSLLAALLISLASTATILAQNQPENTEESEAHDYTRPTLLYIFSEEEEEDSAHQPTTEFEYQTRNWNFRWMPLLQNIVANTDMGHATLMPIPNPFALLGMSYPETASTYPDRGPQTRYRKRMVAAVDANNRAEKARRLGQ